MSARASDSGRYWSSRASAPISPIGMTSISVRSMPRPWLQRIRSSNSMSLTPRSATALILIVQAGLLGGVEAAHHLVEVAPARQLAELVRVERVHRHVHAPHADGGQLLGILGELAAVGGERQLVERAAVEMPAQSAEQRHHVLAHQRLAAGQPELLDAAPDEGRCTGAPAPRATAPRPWAGRSCPRPCNRRSGSRSDPSPRRADR